MVKLKIVIPVVLLALVAAFVLYGINQAEATPQNVSVTIVASDFKYEPATIKVKSGQQVHLTFKNLGTIMHDMELKELHDGTKARPGKEALLNFTAPTPGVYKFACSIPGHDSMVG